MPTVYSPPVNTYIPLAAITLASATSSVTLTGFSQDYRDLVVVWDGTTTAGGGVNVTINGDTSLTRVFMYGSGSTKDSGTSNGQEIFYAYTTQSNAVMQFMDYSATDKHKTILTRANASVISLAQVNRWANTAAITSIKFDNKTFTAGSTFKIFGIEA